MEADGGKALRPTINEQSIRNNSSIISHSARALCTVGSANSGIPVGILGFDGFIQSLLAWSFVIIWALSSSGAASFQVRKMASLCFALQKLLAYSVGSFT